MAETVTSVVIQEAVNQVLCSIKEKYNEGNSDAKKHMERLEMAHIRLEATLETSNTWQVTSLPLLRWRSKLKRAAQECDDMLRRCKQRFEDEEEVDRRLRTSSFPRRVVHTTRSLVGSIFNCSNNEPSRSTVRRFEWFAEGASEFLRYVESASTPYRHIPLEPLVRYLLAGKGTTHRFILGSQCLSFMIRPVSHPKHGMRCKLKFWLQDGDVLENNFVLGIHLRLSESTDIFGSIIRCLELFTPHLRSTVATVQTKLTHLPMQDFIWVPSLSVSTQTEHWDNLHTILYQWCRPNPLCCQQHNHDDVKSFAASSTSSLSESFHHDIYLEPVTAVYLQGHITFSSEHTRQRAVARGGACPTRDLSLLKFAGIFSPHASSDDLLSPTHGGSATEMINGEALQYANISFEQLGEIMLPNAVDCLHRDDTVTLYQMLWKSKHASAYVQIEETSWRATNGDGKYQKWPGTKMQRWTSGFGEFMGSWVVYAPVQLQGPITDWVRKEKENQMLLLGEDKTSTETNKSS